MIDPAEKPISRVEVLPATAEQAPILANLFQLYAHDFSEFFDIEPGPDGRFVYKSLPLYWRESARHPFLIWAHGQLAGFVLMKKGSEVSAAAHVWDMAEFFILRKYQRCGFGTQVASELWSRFPGAWEVRVMQLNVSAQRFWSRAIAEFTGKAIDPVRFEKDGEAWILFSFESKGGT
jgi:predicted acetyltransferase